MMLHETSSYVADRPNWRTEGQVTVPAPWRHQAFYANTGKRVFDVIVAALMLVLLSPTILFLALLIAATTDGLPFYRHRRIGRGGKEFNCLKLRTMVPNSTDHLKSLLTTDPEAEREWRENQKLRNDPRITAVGRFLRKTSLDELPQLWNVLCGDMSLVGPRPVVAEELERYQQAKVAYLAVRPGLTGPWQIAPQRNEQSYAFRISLDREYATCVAFGKDLAILLGTVRWAMNPNGL